MFVYLIKAMLDRDKIESSLIHPTGNPKDHLRGVTYPNHPLEYARLDKSKLLDVDYFYPFQITMFLLVILGIVVALLVYYYFNGAWDKKTEFVSEMNFYFFTVFYIILTTLMLFTYYCNTYSVPFWK